jgi:hypothetical protein
VHKRDGESYSMGCLRNGLCSSKSRGWPSLRILAGVVIAVLFFVLVLDYGITEAQNRFLPYNSSKRYTLSGDVTLRYENIEGAKADDSLNIYSYSANLGIDGYVLDPRVLTFDARGFFSQEYQDPGDTLDFNGFFSKVRLLNERPRRGLLRYSPQPIELRYAYNDSEGSEYQSYGISLGYQLARKKHVARNNNYNNYNYNNNERVNEPFITLPNVYFDYDRVEFTTALNETQSDLISLRGEAWSKHGSYAADYVSREYSGRLNTKEEFVDAQADFHYVNGASRSFLDIYNRFKWWDALTEEYSLVNNRTIWKKYLGKGGRDYLYIKGGGSYLTSDSRDEFDVNAGSSYGKHFSELAMNTVSVDGQYGQIDDEEMRSAQIFNILSLPIPGRLLFENRILAGMNESGPIYGFRVGVSTRTRISLSPFYDFRHSESSFDKRTDHRYSLGISGVLFRNVRFRSNNYYLLSAVNNEMESFTERTLYLQGNLFWRINRYNVTVGMNKTEVEQVNGTTIKRYATSARAGIDTYLSRNMRLSVFAYYQETSDSPSITMIEPILNWALRKLVITAQYRVRFIDSEENDHRIYIRASRYFNTVL